MTATHGQRVPTRDPRFQREFAEDLQRRCGSHEVLALFRRFSRDDSDFDALMRRICLLALTKSCGDDVSVAPNVSLKHPETFQVGNGVVIGEGSVIQGRFDGCFSLGDMVWIGPQSFLDARDLVIGDHVGWGPGAKVLGSEHIGTPVSVPIIATDLRIAPVRVEPWADIGTNAIILPGVTIGRGAIVGAGSVVTRDVPPFAKVAGQPARLLGWRNGKGSSHSEPAGVPPAGKEA